ncbi:MAG TPA: sulfotransferase [Gammaproteobacteria bacterium]|jgi:hypothetical protein|nr:sulfotransferase [Gammaproteobacteria bacterium]
MFNRVSMAGFKAAQREPERVFTLAYEALLRNPKQKAQKLCAFLGIDWFKAGITPAAQKHAGEQAITVSSDWVWYYAQTHNSNLHTDSVDKWRIQLAPSQ